MSYENLEFLYCGKCSREMALERDFLKEVNFMSCPYCWEPMLMETMLPGRSSYSKRDLKERDKVLSKGYYSRSKEYLPSDLSDILFQIVPDKAAEVIIKPEDQDCHHWSIEYYLLKWDKDKGYVRGLKGE